MMRFGRFFTRRKLYVLALLLVILIWAVQACFSSLVQPDISVDPDGNYIKNGSFEIQEKGLIAGWTFEKRAFNKGEFSVARDKAHSGLFSLRLAPNRKNSPSDIAHNPLGFGQAFPARSFLGKKIYVSAWLNAEGGAAAVVGLYALRKDGGVNFIRLEQKAPAASFVFHEDVLLVPDDKNIQYIILNCSVEGIEGAAYFDDIVMSTQIPSQWGTAGSKTEAGVPLSASVLIRADQEIRKIPATLYGSNTEWIWDGNGIWDSKRNALNQEIIQHARDLKVTLLRFPGGIFCDFYHWKDGIGPQGSRKETQHSPGGPRSVHRFGTDEALAFAKQIGGQLLITVNIVTGDQEEAASWVHYLNGRGDSRVTYWEIGNESYIKDDSPFAKPATMAPQIYADKFLKFAKAMRAADHSIKLLAISDEDYGKYSQKGYPNWTDEVLSRAGGAIDYISVHNAYVPKIDFDKGWSVRTVYEAMLAAPVLIKENIEKLTAKLEKYEKARGSRINIAITEWGPYFQVRPSDRFVDHVKTLGSSLYVASVMKVFLESPRVEIANFFKLVEATFMGWIGPRGKGYIPKAPYLAFQMYRQHFGSTVVTSAVTSPTYDSPHVGMVDAVQKVPYLDVIASKSNDGKTLYMIAVNKHFESPIRTKITLRGFNPRADGTAWTLNGTGIDANTGTELYQAPGFTWAKQAEDNVNPRFYKGGPEEVKVTAEKLGGIAEGFEYTFPAHSVTAIEMKVK